LAAAGVSDGFDFPLGNGNDPNNPRVTQGWCVIDARPQPHLGIDWGAPSGTPVYAVSRGWVHRRAWVSGYGNAIQLRHVLPDGSTWYSWYGHLRDPGLPAVGSEVGRRQHIGYVGATGDVTGPHLHFAISSSGGIPPGYGACGSGGTVDPIAFINARRNLAPTPPPDRDGDGVPDADDHCPEVPGERTTGCPSIDGVPFDANGDGRTDLVHRWSVGVNTWLSNGDGSYTIKTQQAHAGYGYGQGVWFASDANGDGRTDLVHRWSQGVNTWLSDGDGTYTIRAHQAQAGYGYGDGVWFASDANGDGRTDLVHRWSVGVNTWLSNGDGSYTIKTQQAHAGYGYGDGQWPPSIYSVSLISRPQPAAQPPPPLSSQQQPPASSEQPPTSRPLAGGKQVRCVVPRLRGRTLRNARRVLRRAGCRLGSVKRRSAGRRLRVRRQRPKAGREVVVGHRVNIVLARRR
jgi:hypothetical protein